jgi:hypothetical protein
MPQRHFAQKKGEMIGNQCPTSQFPNKMRSQTTTTTTTLSPGRVGGSRSNVLNTADLHAGTGEGTESGLSTGAGGLGAVTYKLNQHHRSSWTFEFSKTYHRWHGS